MRSEGYGCVSVCLSVCLSVTALAATAFVSTCNQRHLRHYYRLYFRKSLPFKSYGVKKPFSRSFGTNETQQLREGQLVGRMLLQRLATGATGVKQARYSQGSTRAARHSYAHAQYTLLHPVPAYEFRRGICTLVLFINPRRACAARLR